MAHDIFISYSSKDKLIADGICANLENAGIRCWIAPRDINPGADFPTEIAKAIANSRIVVLVFSQNANQSADISNELYLAFNNKITIVPFKIENVEPEPGKAYYLGRTHWLDAMTPPTLEQINTLIRTVKNYLSYKPEDNSAPFHNNQPKQKLSKKNLGLLIGIPLFVLILLLGLYIIPKLTTINGLAKSTPIVASDMNASSTYHVDFLNTQFDGSLPKTISIDQTNCKDITVLQNAKMLELQVPENIQPSCHFNFADVPIKTYSEIKELDFTILSSPDTLLPHPSFGLIFGTANNTDLMFVCGLGTDGCEIKESGQLVYKTEQITEQPGIPYTFKIEIIDPTLMKTRFSVNDQILGEYSFSKEKAQQFKDQTFNFGISIYDGNLTKVNGNFYLQSIDLLIK